MIQNNEAGEEGKGLMTDDCGPSSVPPPRWDNNVITSELLSAPSDL